MFAGNYFARNLMGFANYDFPPIAMREFFVRGSKPPSFNLFHLVPPLFIYGKNLLRLKLSQPKAKTQRLCYGRTHIPY